MDSRNWKTTVAGILEILCALAAFFGFVALTFASGIVGFALEKEAPEVPAEWIVGLLGFFAVFTLCVAIVALVGGLRALSGRGFGWPLAGAIASLLACGPLGLPALVLVVIAEPDLRAPGG